MKEEYELSIVIPAYNELESLPYLLEDYHEEKKNVKFQLVIVDNGSTDGTAEYLKKECSKKENKFIKVVTVERNIGYGHGIHQGLMACDANVVGWSHGDLQCDPNDVFRGYKIFKRKNNPKILVKGRRYGRYWKSLLLKSGLSFYSFLVLLKHFDDINGQPKIFHRHLLKSFKRPPRGFTYDLYVQYKVLKRKYHVIGFNVFFDERKYGESKWSNSIIAKISTIKMWAVDIIKIRLGKLR